MLGLCYGDCNKRFAGGVRILGELSDAGKKANLADRALSAKFRSLGRLSHE